MSAGRVTDSLFPFRYLLLVALLTPFTLAADVVLAVALIPGIVMIESDGPWPFTPELWRRLIG